MVANEPITPPHAGTVQGNVPAAKRTVRPDPAEPKAARAAPATPRRPDSPEHAAALDRLDRLLERDGEDGPPREPLLRGTYLNIVV